jgi:hypothetical protein
MSFKVGDIVRGRSLYSNNKFSYIKEAEVIDVSKNNSNLMTIKVLDCNLYGILNEEVQNDIEKNFIVDMNYFKNYNKSEEGIARVKEDIIDFSENYSLEEKIKLCKEILGEDLDCMNDNCHSFNELYIHRTLLFASLINISNENLTWKSKLHHDRTSYDGYFIVGIETEEGQATYHVENKYWYYFLCKEIETAPPFDGHTPEESISRIFDHYNKIGVDKFLKREVKEIVKRKRNFLK